MKGEANSLHAIIFMILASALFASTSILAKILSNDAVGIPLHPLQISHSRFLFAFLAIASITAVLRPKIIKSNLKLHVIRTCSGWLGISLMFAAISYIPLSDASAISFLSPVFAMMLAIPLLNERVGAIRWAAAGIALAGAFILLRPTPSSFQPAAILALASAVAMGLEVILIKLLTGRERPLQILLINNTIGLLIASLPVWFFWITPNLIQWLLLASIGITMLMGQGCFIQAMRRSEASFIAPFSYATLIFVIFYDFIVFSSLPDIISILGAIIIISGALLLAFHVARLQQ